MSLIRFWNILKTQLGKDATHQHSSVRRPAIQLFCQYFLNFLLLLTLSLSTAVHADSIDVKEARIEHSDEGYKLATSFDFELNSGLEDAISRGVPLYFTTEVELTRPRWYWLDEKTLRASLTQKLSYNILTRKYTIAIPDGMHRSVSTLDEALFMIRRPNRWLLASRGSLKAGETYNVSLRMGLNLEFMSKPFQVNAINNSDWRLTSGRKSFSFKVDEK